MRRSLSLLPAALSLVVALAGCPNYPAVASGAGGSGGGSGGSGGVGGSGGGSGGSGGGSAGSGGGSALPCDERGGEASCTADGACRWLTPGCGDPALEQPGCFPLEDCARSAPCAPGLACLPRFIDPCGDSGCAACGAEVLLCVPMAACEGAFLDGTGSCRAPDDGSAPPECCAPYDCDQSHSRCRSLPPICEAGAVPTINATACWGPCVPEALCAVPDARERLCAATNGRWDPLGCGDVACGVPIACDAEIPGCDCGPGRNFDPQGGCFQDAACAAGDDRALCEQTGGLWVTQTCGDWWCGEMPICAALIPGCNCFAGSTFVQGQGCLRDPSCPGGGGGVGDPCGGPEGLPCQDGLVCDQRADPGFPGICVEPNPDACLSDADCPAGTLCCYPCGMGGCTNRCTPPDSTGSCPLYP